VYAEASLARNTFRIVRISSCIALAAILVPAGLSAQATGRLKVSATVVATQTVAPQSSAAEFAESAVERVRRGERLQVQVADRAKVDEAGVTVSMDVVEHPVRVGPVPEPADGDRKHVVHVTVAYAGN
jgi:hypothetical protein